MTEFLHVEVCLGFPEAVVGEGREQGFELKYLGWGGGDDEEEAQSVEQSRRLEARHASASLVALEPVPAALAPTPLHLICQTDATVARVA